MVAGPAFTVHASIPVLRMLESGFRSLVWTRFVPSCKPGRGDRERPEVIDPRYEGRNTDMIQTDPSGNLLVFWTPTSLHNS